jgi:hypothetical protein
MALPDLTGQNIENTYQRVLHTDGTNLFNGTGSIVGSLNLDVKQFTANGDAQFYNPTVFGDNVDMQGNINLIGNVTASGVIRASAFVNTDNVNLGLNLRGAGTEITGALDVTQDITATNITASGDISASGTITGNSIVGTLATAAQTTISSLANSVTVGTLDRKLTLTGGNSFLAQHPTLTGGAGIINFASGINITGEYKLSFDNDTDNTYIKANSDNPEDLEIHADQDIILNPDNQVIVNSNISSSGTVIAASFVGNMDGGSF